MLSQASNILKLINFKIGLNPHNYKHLGPIDLLILQPTPYCNLDCSYCYLSDADKLDKSVMSDEVLLQTLTRVLESKLINKKKGLSVVWHAGEPLVAGLEWYQNATKIINNIFPKDFIVTQYFQTNGTLINDDWCDFFKENKCSVGVSIDGPQEINDIKRKTRTGRGSYKAAKKGIDCLIKNKQDFHTISVLTKESIKEPKAFYDFLKGIGSTYACFNIEEAEGANLKSSLSSVTSEALTKNFFNTYYDLMKKDKFSHQCREIHGAQGKIMSWTKNINKFIAYGQESWPFKIISVTNKGDFFSFSPELLGQNSEQWGPYVLGNVKDISFADSIKTDKYKRIVDSIQNGIRKCKKSCDYYDFCGGGSPSNKITENGSFDSTETQHCRLNTKTLINLFLDKIDHVINTKKTRLTKLS